MFCSNFAYGQVQETQLEIPRYEIALREIVDVQTQNLRNFVVTIPNVVRVDRLPGDLLRIEGVGQGLTFIHIWDENGRKTYEIEVVGFGSASVNRLKRKGYDPRGAQLSYRMRVFGERTRNIGWREPIYEHEFEARVPVKERSEWYTIGRASTNPRVLDGISGLPFSQASEPTYMLSYFRSPRFTLAVGDTAFSASELSIRGFPFRGGLFEYHNGYDRAQVFGGWARPVFGFGDYVKIKKPHVFGFSGTKQVLGNVFFHNSFVFLNQDGALDVDGTPFEDDYIYSIGMSARPLKKNIYLEGEYGRSKLDNSLRFLIEWRPYWGNILAYYRRIGTNYVDLSRGFLNNDFHEANFSANFKPTRRLSFNASYNFYEFGLSDNSEFNSTNHSVYLTGRFVKNMDLNYLASFTLSRSESANTSFETERGTMVYERYFDQRKSRLYAQVYGEHSQRTTLSPNRVRNELGGGFDVRYRRFLKENLELLGNSSLSMFRVTADASQPEGGSLLTSMSWGPEIHYIRDNLLLTGGFNHNFNFGSEQNSHYIQPFVSAVYQPNQAFALEGRANANYGFSDDDYTVNLVGQVTYRFGPGIPDSPFSSQSRQSVKVKGQVFLDDNANGVKDEGEKLVSGLVVKHNQKEILVKDGSFQFKAKPIEDTVSLVLSEQYNNFRVTAPNPLQVEGIPGETVNVNFGLFEGTLLVGKVVDDSNQNSQDDAKESAPLGMQVRVTGQGFEKIVDVSGGTGLYSLNVPRSGIYQAELISKTLPTGYQLGEVNQVTAEVEQNKLGKFFPLFIQSQRAIFGTAFIDDNNNNVHDEGEELLSGIEVRVGDYSAMSDSDGTFVIKSLIPGDYKVKIQPQTIRGHQLKLPKATINFRNQPQTIELNLGYQ